jgi:glucose/arabinose dehydrogenase
MRKTLIVLPILALVGVSFITLAQSKDVIEDAKAEVQDGEELYLNNCATCHGDNLEGGAAKGLKTGDWKFITSNDQFKSLIKSGDEELGMPAFGDLLNMSDIDAVVKFVNVQAKAKKVTAATDVEKVKNGTVSTEVWVDGLDAPWALQFTGPSSGLVTEVSGNLRQIKNGDLAAEPVSGTPSVWHGGQGGMLDVAIDPEFEENGWIYLSFSHRVKPGSDKAMTKIVRGHIVENQWQDEQVLFSAKTQHYLKARVHFGSRITFDNEGHLYFSIGDRGQKDMAQDITRPNGKIHRINKDGSIPDDNPFIGNPKAYPSIYSFGNRNPQGLVFSDGQLWETEHGPKGGDELNSIKSGANYGWPVISYGRNYSGTELTPYTHMDGMEQPVSQWTPSIAACGLDVYQGELFDGWQGHLLAGSLKYQELRLIKLENGQYIGEQILIKDRGRVRDVTVGPDGAIYVVLNSPDQILRLTPFLENEDP